MTYQKHLHDRWRNHRVDAQHAGSGRRGDSGNPGATVVDYLARYSVAIAAALVTASPASAALVTPIAATIDNQSYISTDGKSLDRLDEEKDAWLLVPRSFSTLTSLNYVSEDGDLAVIGQRFNANWTSPVAGSIDFDVDEIVSPKVADVGVRAGNPFGGIDYSELTYRFVANSDGILTVKYDFTGNFLVPAGANTYKCNCGGIELYDVTHSTYIGDSLPGPIDDIYNLDAGVTYIMLFNMGVSLQPADNPPVHGSYSISAKNHIDFTIIDRPDSGSSAPEPTAWAMMLAGFSAVGMTLRRGRRCAVSSASAFR